MCVYVCVFVCVLCAQLAVCECMDVCACVCVCVCVYVLLLLLLLDRNKQPVTAALTSRTPIGSRDPFSPFPGKLGSLFYNRDSYKKKL